MKLATLFLCAVLTVAPPERIRVGATMATVHTCVWNDLKPIQHCFPTDGPLDSLYALPSQKQIEQINKAVKIIEPASYNSHDCDDIALEYYIEARRFARKNSLAPVGSALAVGALFVRIDGPLVDLGINWEIKYPAYHVLITILRDDCEWLVIEPQNGRMILWKSLYYEGNISVMKILI